MTNWQTNTKSVSSILEQNAFSFFLLQAFEEIAQDFFLMFSYIFFYFPCADNISTCAQTCMLLALKLNMAGA